MPISHRSIAGAAAVFVLGVAGIAAVADDRVESTRQDDVARRGAQVMPFDLDATTHRFIRRSDGGRQVVVADRPDDRRQVALIRQHLRAEARAFARGDFDDPAAIHGATMPGLTTLRSSGDRLTVQVRDRPDGAELTYRTSDGAVRDALHDWFDAQVRDHGEHAEGH